MNRVYPLREGSGECVALVRLDAGVSREFRAGLEKISREIISLLKRLSRLRHSQARPWLETEHHAQRHDVRAARVADVEGLVLEPAADVAEVRLRADTPGKFGSVVRQREQGTARRSGVAAARVPAREPCLAEQVEKWQRKRQEAHRVGGECLVF